MFASLKTFTTLALATIGILSLGERLDAALVIQFQEIGGNVIAKTTGSVTVPSVAPYYRQLSGDFLGGGDLDLYSMKGGFTQWQGGDAAAFSSGLSIAPTSSVGDTFGYSGTNLFLPLVSTAGDTYTPVTTWTWDGQTLASIGLGGLSSTLFTAFNGFGVTISFVLISAPPPGGMIDNTAYPGQPTENVMINGPWTTSNAANFVDALTFNTTSATSDLVITGSVTNTSGNVTVVQGIATISGDPFLMAGDMTKNGPGTLDTTGTVGVPGDLNVEAGTYKINGVTLVGGTTYVSPDATLGGGGFLTSPQVFVDGTLNPGNSPGILTVNGNVTLSNSSVFILEIASASTFDQLVANGTVNLAGALDVTSWNGFDQFTYGQKFAFIHADDIEGTFDTITMPNSAELRGRFVVDGGTGTLVVAPTSYTLVAQNQNQRNVARALDTFIPATSGDEMEVSTALDLQSEGEYGNAFDQIAPGFYQTLTNTVIEQTNAQNQMLAQRLSGVRLGARGFSVIGLEQAALKVDRDGKSVMDAKGEKDIISQENATDWGVFVMGNGIFSKVTNVSQVPNYKFNSGGFIVGIDYTFGGDKTTSTAGEGKKAVVETISEGSSLTLGLYTGYQGTYAKYTGGGWSTINSALFGVYTSYSNGGFYANTIVGGAYNGYDAARSISFSTVDRTARSQPNGGSFTSYVDAGYDFKAGSFTFGPLLSAQYIYAGVAPFSETGADSLDLRVGNANANSFRTNVGGRIAYTWQLTPSITLIPEGRMFWQHEYMDGAESYDAALDGGSGAMFNYSPSNPDRDSVFAGAGVNAYFGDRWSTSLYYNADFGRQDYVSHMISGGVGWKF